MWRRLSPNWGKWACQKPELMLKTCPSWENSFCLPFLHLLCINRSHRSSLYCCLQGPRGGGGGPWWGNGCVCMKLKAALVETMVIWGHSDLSLPSFILLLQRSQWERQSWLLGTASSPTAHLLLLGRRELKSGETLTRLIWKENAKGSDLSIVFCLGILIVQAVPFQAFTSQYRATNSTLTKFCENKSLY